MALGARHAACVVFALLRIGLFTPNGFNGTVACVSSSPRGVHPFNESQFDKGLCNFADFFHVLQLLRFVESIARFHPQSAIR